MRGGAWVPGQRMGGERAAEGCGSRLRIPDRDVVVEHQLREETLLGPSEALLLVQLEHLWPGSVGPGLWSAPTACCYHHFVARAFSAEFHPCCIHLLPSVFVLCS